MGAPGHRASIGKRLSLAPILVLTLWLLSAPAAHAASAPHVMVVVMENHSYESVVGNPKMPFVNSLVAANGSVSTADLSHPSLPNYLGLVSGSIQNNPQDTTPQDGTYPGPQLTDELAAAGIGWKAYMEDMQQPCDLTDQFGPGHYDVNHNPFMYFNSVRSNASQCNRDVPYGQLASDLAAGSAPPFMWVSPNTIDDTHDGTDAQGDQFLQGLVNLVRGSSWWTPSSRIVITWDEGTQSEQVLTLVVGSAHGTAAAGGNAYGALRGIEELYGVGLIGHSGDSNVGDLLPLLNGPAGTKPPPSNPPTAASSPPASPSTPTTAPSASAASTSPSVAQTSPTATPSAGGPSYVRGVYGRDSSASGLSDIEASGFNAVMADPFRELLNPVSASGLKGIVWLGAWVNAPTCSFERSDATIEAQVGAVAGNPGILAYYLGDEPRVTECPNAPAMFKQRSDLVHRLDPGSTTFTVVQAYENGVSHDYAPWRGTVDVVGFDVYPCARASSSCTLADIDSAVAAIRKAGIDRYWAVIQDFQDCYYRLPTRAELAGQFDHWARSSMSGYLVFSWNYQAANTACVGTTLDKHADNVAQLKAENARSFSPGGAGAIPSRSQPSAVNAAAALAHGALPLAAGIVAIGAGIVLIAFLRRERRAALSVEPVEEPPVGPGEVDLVAGRGDVDKPG
jgi:phosphatidylinositol-3-phosphatase